MRSFKIHRCLNFIRSRFTTSKNKLSQDSPFPKFLHLKIRRRNGVESLTTLEEGEFKFAIDGCIKLIYVVMKFIMLEKMLVNKYLFGKHFRNSGTHCVQWCIQFTNTKNVLSETKYIQKMYKYKLKVLVQEHLQNIQQTELRVSVVMNRYSFSKLFSKDFYTNCQRADEQCELGH